MLIKFIKQKVLIPIILSCILSSNFINNSIKAIDNNLVSLSYNLDNLSKKAGGLPVVLPPAAPAVPAAPIFKYTQTNAYMTRDALRGVVDRNYQFKMVGIVPNPPLKQSIFTVDATGKVTISPTAGPLNPYKKIIDKVLEREAYYKNYFVFYHAHTYKLEIPEDFNMEMCILSKKCAATARDNFVFLRAFKKEFSGLGKLNDWLDKSIKMFNANPQGGLLNNHPKIQPFLLSTNLSIFGNTLNSGSCTLEYFLDSTSLLFNLDAIMDSALADWVKDPIERNKFKQELLNLDALIRTTEGRLLQIFIPKGVVDENAYLSEVGGTPWHVKLGNIPSYDSIQNRYLKISPVLEVYRNDPSNAVLNTPAPPAQPPLDGMQARLFLRKRTFGDPNGKLRIFKYSTLSDARQKAYKKQLEDIAKRVYQYHLANK